MAVPLFIVSQNLAPSQSFTLHAMWNGVQNEGQSMGPTGTFVVHNQLASNGPTATITIEDPTPSATGSGSRNEGSPAVPSGGSGRQTPTAPDAPKVPNDPVSETPAISPLVVSLTTDQRSYRKGSPVHVTITESNTTNHDLAVYAGGHIVSLQMSQNNKPVWQYHDTRGLLASRAVLKAGQTRRWTLVWNGRPNAAGAKIAPGTYTLDGGVDGMSGTTTIQITKR
jgi:hypothetical protein